jgi:tRNA-dihydrouridine synthase
MRAADETGLVPQILGNDEKYIAPSVEKLVQWGAAAIDINMGCPVQKALKHNYGVALMGDPTYAAEVVRITKKHSTVPVSVKLRAGLQNDFDYLHRFIDGLVEAGVDWICLHPRTSSQQRRGSADWEQIRRIKELIPIPLIGNGDVQIVDDVFAMMEQTGCDRVMSGRALAARPWMLWQVGEKLGLPNPSGIEETRKAPHSQEEEGAEYGKCLSLLLEHLVNYFGEDLALRKFRFHVKTTMVWLLFGQALWAECTKAKTVEETREVLRNFFAQPVAMLARTDLRQ